MAEPRVILVAKPWKGGLGRYLFLALQNMFAGRVQWLPTHPGWTRERIGYGIDRASWHRALVRRIGGYKDAICIFVNHLPAFRELPFREQHVIWITDRPRVQADDLAPFGRIFLSDPGYARDLPETARLDRYEGELGFAHHPEIHRPVAGPPPSRELCFVGNRDPRRDPYLEFLLSSGRCPTIVGNYFLTRGLFWRRPWCFRPSVSYAATGRIYARHHVALNVHARVVREGTNMRTFECAGYQIPLLAEYSPGIERCFEPGREIVLFRNNDELSQGLGRLIADERWAQELARAARRRALAEHTYYHRLARMLGGLVPRDTLRPWL